MKHQRRTGCGNDHDGNTRSPISSDDSQRDDGVPRGKSEAMDIASTRHKPGLEDWLRAIDLDVAYQRGEGDVLYYRCNDGQETEVVDFVGGYGALLLGHHHPAIVAAMMEFLASTQANHVQGSIRTRARQLADALNARSQGDYCTILANSGTEAVEVALKHALLETQGSTFIALQGAFHGNTLGSLHATFNPRFRRPFCHAPGNVVHVVPNDIKQLKETFDRVDDLAGFIFEPIQGEAGVRALTPEFVDAAAKLCADRNIPLIADECQTGMGRTGTFLASELYGISADSIILSKALGGGLAKISAVLVKRSRYRREFDLIHSSTFADDELSCHVALKTLNLIDDHAIAACRRKGCYLLRHLRALHKLYPSVIADVRGRGLMLGFELRRAGPQSGFVLQHLSDRQLLGPLVASYLLNQHRIRVASTLSDPWTIRLQPSLLISRDRMRQLVAALKDVCDKLAENDVAGLLGFLARPRALNGSVPIEPSAEAPVYHFHPDQTSQKAKSVERAAVRRVAWLFHLVDSSDLAHMDPALKALTLEEKHAFCQRWSTLCEPVVMPTVDICSLAGNVVRLYPILLPVTSPWMLRHHSRAKNNVSSRLLVQRGVKAAAALGCDVVTLGQFTSIVSRQGKSLDNHEMQITSGSNYTAALISQAVRAELNQRSWDPAGLTLGVVGAAGDIASTCAALMASEYRQCILVGSGNATSLPRLEQLASRIPRARVEPCLQAIAEAHVVVCATNSTTAPLGPECLRSDAIICDASVPATLQPRIRHALPELTFLPGGIAALPGKEALDIPGFPLPRGLTYGCMAEGLLLGLDVDRKTLWSGRSSAQRAWEISEIADRHGFTAAPRMSTTNCCESTI